VKIDLTDVYKLKFPVTINGRRYEHRRPGLLIAESDRIRFRSPKNAVIDIIVQSSSIIEFRVDNVYIGGCRDTSEIGSSSLRALIERAVNDLSSEVKRTDPAHRKAQAAVETKRQADEAERKKRAIGKL
jgi:hypothetical protein